MSKKIVILGASYGGLMTAIQLQKHLRDSKAQVTLVHPHTYHEPASQLHRIDIHNMLDAKTIQFVEATVERIQPGKRMVRLSNGRILDYDYLVIGLDSEPEWFGIRGLKDHAFSICSRNSVRMMKDHIEFMFAKFRHEPHRTDYLTFVIGGDEFMGMELAAEVAYRIPQLCRAFEVDPSMVHLYYIEAEPNDLPSMEQELVGYTTKVLQNERVIFKRNTAIQECHSNGVVLATGEEIHTQTVVWTGGLCGNPIVEKAGFEVERGRVKVDEYLRAPGYDHVFIVGDCALLFEEEGRSSRPTAQLAIKQGKHLAASLVQILSGGNPLPFIQKILIT